MEVLKFVKRFMEINGTLATFDSTLLGRFLVSLKIVLVLLLGPINFILPISAIIFLNLNDFEFIISKMYYILGCLFALLMHLSLSSQSNDIGILLKDLQTLVNESKYILSKENQKFIRIKFCVFIFSLLGIKQGEFGHAYFETERKLTKFAKILGKVWVVVLSAFSGIPFLIALMDFVTGHYSVSSWILMVPGL